MSGYKSARGVVVTRSSWAYYNEIDEYCAEWLRNLIRAGLIPKGDVDSRSIRDVKADELTAYTQCHFFAGLGGWPYAARLAGWPDSEPLWTGSCPCQPFSVAGKGEGECDERHLWPDLHRHICFNRPVRVVGEQVAGEAGYDWFHGVRADLAEERYQARAVDIPSGSVNAPNRRNRIYWVAEREESDGLADPNHPIRRSDSAGRDKSHRQATGRREGDSDVAERCTGNGVGRVADTTRTRRGEECPDSIREFEGDRAEGRTAGSVPGRFNFWDYFTLIGPDRDGKYRRIEPGTFPVAPRVPETMALLRAFGNAINPELAAEVIRAYMDVRGIKPVYHPAIVEMLAQNGQGVMNV